MSSHKFLVHEYGDHVGVAVQNINTGEEVMGVSLEDGHEYHVTSNADIPLGHKIALVDLEVGDMLVKYGVEVGKITQNVKVGDWVHTHNLKTARWDYGN